MTERPHRDESVRLEAAEIVAEANANTMRQWEAEAKRLRYELDRMRRLWNRLEAAVSHHKKRTARFSTNIDDALYKARDKVLRDYAEGKG